MKIFFALALIVVSGSFALADEQPVADGTDGTFFQALSSTQTPTNQTATKQGPCSKVNLTDAQKTQLKNAAFSFRQTKISLEAQVKTAKLNFAKLASDSKADYESAQAAGQSVATAVGQMISTKLAFKTQVLFQILTAEQRGPAMACERAMKRFKARKNAQSRGGRRQGWQSSKNQIAS